MKKYRICLFLFLAVSALCLWIGCSVQRSQDRNQKETEIESESVTETATEDQIAANQKQVEAYPLREEYYLVAEDGVLLVFLKDQKTICLYTHVPLMDFPAAERTKLREGIWFSSMEEMFHYLESYTS